MRLRDEIDARLARHVEELTGFPAFVALESGTARKEDYDRFIAIDDNNLRAVSSEAISNRLADSRCRAGDKSNSVLNMHSLRSFSPAALAS